MLSSLNKSISDLNLGMLYLAREALRQDQQQGLLNLGITPEVAHTLLSLSTDEISHLAQTPLLLVGLRWRSSSVWNSLCQYARGSADALPRALLLGEGELDHVH